MSELLKGLTQEVHAMVLSSYMPDVGGKPGSWSWQFNLQALRKQCAEMLKWGEELDHKPGFHGEALFCTQDIWRSEHFNTTQGSSRIGRSSPLKGVIVLERLFPISL